MRGSRATGDQRSLVESKERNLIPFENRTGETAGSERTRIYVDSIVPNLGLAYRGVTVHDEFLKAAIVAEEIFPDPEKVLITLLGQRDARPDAGMDKKIIP